MVLILSNENEPTTDYVLEWLLHFNVVFLRLTDKDAITLHNLVIENKGKPDFLIKIEGKGEIKFSDITAYWYRRGYFNLCLNSINEFREKKLNSIFFNYSIQEREALTSFVNFLLLYKKSIGSFNHNFTNKLVNLTLASSVGLTIPDTFISSSSKELKDYCNSKQAITKAINIIRSFNYKNDFYNTFTSNFTEADINDKYEIFFPTLLQEKIDKKIELRIFFLNSKFYTEAIFSQQDQATSTDFRNYNVERPNRTIPYALPLDIQKKLLKFFKKTRLNCGSIDMILTPNNEYVFLEVNPIGQFQQVSYPCNYYLEKKIALTLKNWNNYEEKRNRITS